MDPVDALVLEWASIHARLANLEGLIDPASRKRPLDDDRIAPAGRGPSALPPRRPIAADAAAEAARGESSRQEAFTGEPP
eukprot:3644253-Prymnesium_polylepis.1